MVASFHKQCVFTIGAARYGAARKKKWESGFGFQEDEHDSFVRFKNSCHFPFGSTSSRKFETLRCETIGFFIMRHTALALSTMLVSAVWLTGCSAPSETTMSDDAATTTDTMATDASETVADLSDPSAQLAAIIADPRRADDAARDQYRHPQGTLEFFEVMPDQRVAEIWPGSYAKILAPYLAENGSYVAVLFPDGLSERVDARNAAFKESYSDAEVYGTVDYGSFSQDTGLSLEDNSVDVILTFRNVHSWMRGNYAEAAFAEFYRALRPGGTLGVVAHRLPETATQDPNASTGYVQESYMKALAADAGFEFVASSEVNANPNDTADHPFGVWTLPPASRTPEEGSAEAESFDADAYLAIGESDRATLKFMKPE